MLVCIDPLLCIAMWTPEQMIRFLSFVPAWSYLLRPVHVVRSLAGGQLSTMPLAGSEEGSECWEPLLQPIFLAQLQHEVRQLWQRCNFISRPANAVGPFDHYLQQGQVQEGDPSGSNAGKICTMAARDLYAFSVYIPRCCYALMQMQMIYTVTNLQLKGCPCASCRGCKRLILGCVPCRCYRRAVRRISSS